MGSSKNSSPADNQQVSRKRKDYYYAGFVDGEGCFYVGFSKRKDLPIPWQVLTEFHVSQNPGGKNILEELKIRLRCGYLKPNHARSIKDKSWVLIIKDREDLNKKVIPFFEKYPLRSAKQQDFLVFKKVLCLIREKKHLTKKGFREIVKLVFSSKKTTNKRYSEKMILSS